MAKKRAPKQVFNLPKRHRWKAKPGNQIFVANRGDVRFEFPGGWVFDDTSGGAGQSVRFFDGKPPDDDIRLEVSVLHILHPAAYQMPLADLLNDSAEDIGDNCRRGKPYSLRLPQHELAWLEMEYIDPGEKRPAFTRLCLARGVGVQTLITLDFWPEDAARAIAAWDDVLGTLKLGEYLEHPFFGPKE